MLLWLAIAAPAAFALVKLIGWRSGTRIPGPTGDPAPGVGASALAIRDLGWSALAGVAGFLVSITAGVFAAGVTMDPDEGATFIAIWFWLAGPPFSAAAMAVVVRFRRWDPPAVGVHAAVAFAVCVLCGLIALAATGPRSPAPPSFDAPTTTDLG